MVEELDKKNENDVEEEEDFVDYDAQVKIEALVNLLVRKGIITEEEFDKEYDKVFDEEDEEE